jgi:hypothetical protein
MLCFFPTSSQLLPFFFVIVMGELFGLEMVDAGFDDGLTKDLFCFDFSGSFSIF